MELQIKAYKAQPIEWNYEELKGQLRTKLQDYKTLQYTADQIQAAKTDRANLNSLKKALSDERIRRKKEFLEPFETFEGQVKELCNLIDEPVKLIDAQIKEVETREKEEKREACRMIFEGTIGVPDWLKFEQIFNEKWLNKTCSAKQISAEIEEKVKKVNDDLIVLSELEYSFEAIEEYKRSLDVSAAMSEAKRMVEIQARKKQAEERTETPQIPFAEAEIIESTPVEETAEEPRVWLAFRANLSKGEALELKAFFNMYSIQYEAIKEA